MIHNDMIYDESHGNGDDALRLAVRRLDELRVAESRRVNETFDAERRRVTEQLMLRAEYDVKLSVAEAKRIDAIRAVDVNAVSVANEKASATAIVLANQVSQSAEALRSLVATTAATQAQQLTALISPLVERLTSLEKAQYESKGSGTGMRDMWGWVFAGLMALVTIGGLVFSLVKP